MHLPDLWAMWAQVHRVQGYDKDQIALVILDLSNFMVQAPIILGTPTISCMVNVIKEIDTLVMPWVNAWVAHHTQRSLGCQQ